jgi:hypothetical protein
LLVWKLQTKFLVQNSIQHFGIGKENLERRLSAIYKQGLCIAV